jgi:hypothetical protein
MEEPTHFDHNSVRLCNTRNVSTGRLVFSAKTSRPKLEQPRATRQVAAQEIHLIGHNMFASRLQDQIFLSQRYLGDIQQRHARFLGRFSAFELIARTTCRHYVRPRVGSTATGRHDVLAFEFVLVKLTTAIGAGIAIALEQLVIESREAGR